MPDSFCACTKPCLKGLLFTRKNSDLGAISVTERKSLKWRVTHHIGVYTMPDSFFADTKTMPERASVHT